MMMMMICSLYFILWSPVMSLSLSLSLSLCICISLCVCIRRNSYKKTKQNLLLSPLFSLFSKNKKKALKPTLAVIPFVTSPNNLSWSHPSIHSFFTHPIQTITTTNTYLPTYIHTYHTYIHTYMMFFFLMVMMWWWYPLLFLLPISIYLWNDLCSLSLFIGTYIHTYIHIS